MSGDPSLIYARERMLDPRAELQFLADAFARVLAWLRDPTPMETEAEMAEIADAALFRAERVLDQRMSGQPSLIHYAYRKTWKGAGPLSGEEKEHITEGVVLAPSMEEAARIAIRKSSVWELEYGVSVDVARVSWAKATRWRARYDQKPFLDHALVNPDAKLVIERA